MNADRPDKYADADQAVTQFEGEIRELIRSRDTDRDVTWLRRSQSRPAGDAGNVNTIIQRVAGASLSEIESLIDHLQHLRGLLQSEGERVQREVAGYAQLSRKAMNHIGSMSEQMAQWHAHLEDGRDDGYPREEIGGERV